MEMLTRLSIQACPVGCHRNLTGGPQGSWSPRVQAKGLGQGSGRVKKWTIPAQTCACHCPEHGTAQASHAQGPHRAEALHFLRLLRDGHCSWQCSASCRGSLRLKTLGEDHSGESGGLGSHIPRFQSRLCHFLALCCWACYLTSC